MSNINFMESIKIVPDAEKEMLLKIQDKLEKEGITLENVLKLTKNLSNNEKQRLKQSKIDFGNEVPKITAAERKLKEKAEKLSKLSVIIKQV